jgi:uncharacterized protein YndB with AHSA1/START domain
MPVIDTKQDLDGLKFTLVAEFDAPVERVWQIWEDPRQLERWWGPPEWPATFSKHEFTPGGKASYYMTGPDGETAGGWWKFTSIEAPHKLVFEDGFADDDGEPVPDMGTTYATVTLESIGGRTRMTTESRFESSEQLEKMLEMGMVEGMESAMGQIDAILAETASV